MGHSGRVTADFTFELEPPTLLPVAEHGHLNRGMGAVKPQVLA